MADVTHRPGWWQASDGTWHATPQGTHRAPARRGERARPLAAPVDETEYRVVRIVRDALTGGELAFGDRRVAGAASAIDLVVVASSGVWVIDAKKRRRFSCRGKGATPRSIRLVSGKADITAQLQQLCSAAEVVAQLVRDPSVPVHPALAVLAEQCGLVTGARLRLGKEIVLRGVVVCAPHHLADRVRQPGPLDRDRITHVGHRLDQAFAGR